MSVVVDDELESVGAVVDVTTVEVVGSAVVEGRTVSSSAKVFTTSVSSVIPDAERLVVSPAQAAKRTPQATEITRTRTAVCARFFAFAFITRDVRPASQHRGQQGVKVAPLPPIAFRPSSPKLPGSHRRRGTHRDGRDSREGCRRRQDPSPPSRPVPQVHC